MILSAGLTIQFLKRVCDHTIKVEEVFWNVLDKECPNTLVQNTEGLSRRVVLYEWFSRFLYKFRYTIQCVFA